MELGIIFSIDITFCWPSSKSKYLSHFSADLILKEPHVTGCKIRWLRGEGVWFNSSTILCRNELTDSAQRDKTFSRWRNKTLAPSSFSCPQPHIASPIFLHTSLFECLFLSEQTSFWSFSTSSLNYSFTYLPTFCRRFLKYLCHKQTCHFLQTLPYTSDSTAHATFAIFLNLLKTKSNLFR
jgi:hypothetical protein